MIQIKLTKQIKYTNYWIHIPKLQSFKGKTEFEKEIQMKFFPNFMMRKQKSAIKHFLHVTVSLSVSLWLCLCFCFSMFFSPIPMNYASFQCMCKIMSSMSSRASSRWFPLDMDSCKYYKRLTQIHNWKFGRIWVDSLMKFYKSNGTHSILISLNNPSLFDFTHTHYLAVDSFIILLFRLFVHAFAIMMNLIDEY